jgi:hypothetical protein
LKSQKTFSVQKDDKELEKKSITPAASKQISGYVARFRERQKNQKDS